MDLSGLIFAGLAIGWAVYLIPKALQHHDEMARTRSVDSFSSRMRVLGGPASAPKPAAPTVVEEVTKRPARDRPAITRASARKAARRRRRVLGLLLLATAVVGVLAWQAITPYWSLAIPGGLVVCFLVVARLTVRRERAVRRPATAAPAEPEVVDLATEDTAEVSREELARAVAAPLVDEGSLWDPLPLTLPTYVSKPTARRTVRTIELTGMSSSGHDAADSALVREAEAKAAEVAVQAAPEAGEGDQRRAAGA